MITFLLSHALSLLWPALSPEIVRLVLILVPAIIDLVRDLDLSEIPPRDRLRAAVDATSKMIDEKFDGLPGWHDISEDRRDRIIASICELVLWLDRLGRKDGKPVGETRKLFQRKG